MAKRHRISNFRTAQGPCCWESYQSGPCDKLATRGLVTEVGNVYVCAEHGMILDEMIQDGTIKRTIDEVLGRTSTDLN